MVNDVYTHLRAEARDDVDDVIRTLQQRQQDAT